VKDPTKEFDKVLRTLGMEVEQNQLDYSVRFSSFSELEQQESTTGFRERPPHAKRFFRQGLSGQWEDTLQRCQVEKIIAAHGKVMTKLGYETSL
jgi:hypothetical protein